MIIRRQDYNKLVEAVGSLTSSNVRLEKAFQEMREISESWKSLYEYEKARNQAK